MKRTSTLSQSFDIGDFIAPDILSIVDANVRAAADDIILRGGLSGDIERIIDLRTGIPYIADTTLSGLVPSMNPDEFMQYDRPKAPVMTGFDEFDAMPVFKETGAELEPLIETAKRPDDKTGPQSIVGFDSVKVEVIIPDLLGIEQAAALIQDDIDLDIPELARFNANLFKVRLDTLRFNRRFMNRLRLVFIIVIIAIANLFMILYLFSM